MDLMLDTVIFNRVLDGKINLSMLNKHIIYATHIQYDELSNTKNEDRRQGLLQVFKRIDPNRSSTESFITGTSRCGGARVGDGNLYTDIRTKLDSKNNCKQNNVNDALIAETSIKNKFTLVTDDNDLIAVVIELKDKVICSQDLF